jgi:hypothetical protein
MGAVSALSKKSIEAPDETRTFSHGHIDVVRLGDTQFARTVFEPGWRWSEAVKPIAQTDSCMFHHKAFVAAGTLHVRMDDGTEMDVTKGEVADITPGHDAWVVGDETCVTYDFGGEDADYAKPPSG